ncbi:MAG: 6-bladed beta-propeller [Dysgonamonadaceae bacterium]|nr:6-bladed beta-propeller [Dysgonamonadaceae bacterium]
MQAQLSPQKKKNCSFFSTPVFSKDGTPQSRFNRLGQGPEEYNNIMRIHYDEKTDDVFVGQEHVNYIQVYSSHGEYKRMGRFWIL